MLLMLCSKKYWASAKENTESTSLMDTEKRTSIIDNLTRIYAPTTA